MGKYSKAHKCIATPWLRNTARENFTNILEAPFCQFPFAKE